MELSCADPDTGARVTGLQRAGVLSLGVAEGGLLLSQLPSF